MTDESPRRGSDPAVRGDGPAGAREWEVFVREAGAEPLRHAGSVTAPTRDTARRRAATLLGWAAEAVWLCPAREIERFDARELETDSPPEPHS